MDQNMSFEEVHEKIQVFVKIDFDGNPAGEFNPDTGDATAGGFLALVNCRSAGGNLVLSGIKISMDQAAGKQDRTFFLRSYATHGPPPPGVLERPQMELLAATTSSLNDCFY